MLSSVNLSVRGFLLDGKTFCSILVSLIRSFVDTSSKRGMVKDKETAGVTEHVIPIPWNVLRPSKVLELWSALSATWCTKCVGSAELDSDTPGILVPGAQLCNVHT